MVVPKKTNWKKTFDRLSMNHYKDQIEVKRLTRSLHWLLITHMQLNFDVAKDAKKYADKMETMENLRSWIDKYLQEYKNHLSPRKKAELLKIKMRLPVDNLSDRIKLMEITEHYNNQMPEDYHGKWNGKHISQLINRLESNVKKLKRIDKKMLLLISDIHDLNTYIEYVKSASVTKGKVKHLITLMKHVNWNVRKSLRNIPSVPRSTKLLQNIPDLLPDMYHYLNT